MGGSGPDRIRRGQRRSDRPEGLGSVLDALRTSQPWDAGMALGDLGRRWHEVVGDRLAGESKPLALRSGTLVLEASSAGWAAQLTFLAREIGARANDVLGRSWVREVRVVVDRGPVRER